MKALPLISVKELFFRLKSTQFRPILAFLFIAIALVFSSCAASKKARARQQQVSTVLQTARSFTGTPYKYGGTTRSGMDCSALTTHAFRSIDISLPRQAEEQATVGEKIKQKEVKPGDLVFFATGKKKREITHVGIVTERKSASDIKFIHASTTLGVVETNLFSDYYQKRFRLARRIID
jgi:cell wall-associated NlpC family hydrolase